MAEHPRRGGAGFGERGQVRVVGVEWVYRIYLALHRLLFNLCYVASSPFLSLSISLSLTLSK